MTQQPHSRTHSTYTYGKDARGGQEGWGWGRPVGVQEVLDLHEGGQHVCISLLARHVCQAPCTTPLSLSSPPTAFKLCPCRLQEHHLQPRAYMCMHWHWTTGKQHDNNMQQRWRDLWTNTMLAHIQKHGVPVVGQVIIRCNSKLSSAFTAAAGAHDGHEQR